VLTYAGSTKVVSKQPGLPQPVYNLEVKDYHNFLVTGAGVVVHNSWINNLYKLLVNKFLLQGSNIPKRLTISSGGNNIFIPSW
jgi:hypothetical protein